MEARPPSVAIVGRVNVGKSTLFNRLAGRRIAIEDRTPGVTRDRVTAVCSFAGAAVELVDTGGEPASGDAYAGDIRAQIDRAVGGAALVLFVVDVVDGITAADGEISRRLRETDAKTILVANKVDGAKRLPAAAEFSTLGFGEPLAVSATTGLGLSDLTGRIAREVPKVQTSQVERNVRIAVVGRVNAGKSTWVNAILGQERMIVSDLPGTTRDAVDIAVSRGRRRIVLVDTAGLKKPKSVDGSVEFYAQNRAVKAIRSADAALFLVDSLREITAVDKKLSALISAESKPVVLVLNKWDAVPPGKKEEFLRYAAQKLPALDGSPVAFTSGLARTGLWETLELAWELGSKTRIWWEPKALSAAVGKAFARHAPKPRRGGRPVSLNGVRQTGVGPVRVAIHTNQPEAFRPDHLRMMARAIRRSGPWREIPIRVEAIGQRRRRADKP